MSDTARATFFVLLIAVAMANHGCSSPCHENARGEEYCEEFGDAENGHYNSYFTKE